MLLLLPAVVLAACAPADGSTPVDSGASAPPDAPAAAADPGAPRWTPPPGSTWQWQLSGKLDLTVEAEIYDVDYATTDRSDVEALQQAGRRTVCYLSAGSWEDFRSDAEAFPPEVRGSVMDGWPDEKWLDIRRMDLLLPLIGDRMETCVAKGFDAVEPDNLDGYVNETGFPLTGEDQLAYNRAVADLAHAHGLSVALKNDMDQIPDLVDSFDFAVNEECVRYGECESYQPFQDAGKAVLHVEYEGPLDFCDESRELGLSSLLKPLDLTAQRESC